MAVERTQRKTRTPIEGMSRSRMRVQGKDAAYEYYIANDTDDRVAIMQEAGWEVVTDKGVTIGDRRVTAPSSEGSAKTLQVGGGITGVLLRIKKEWWEEDQLAKQERAAATVKDTIRTAKDSADYGKVEGSF